MRRVSFIRKVKYERELQRDLPAEVMATPGGEKILSCLQCGTCGGACPLSVYMDRTPRQLIGMLREGFKQEVVESFAIWLCASCYECTVLCPAGIKVTDVMYALKRIAIHEGIYPRRFPIPVLAKEFMEMLKGTGRNNEFWLVLRVLLKTAPRAYELKRSDRGWRHRWHSCGSHPGRRRQAGLSGRAKTLHRWTHGAVRQDLSNA